MNNKKGITKTVFGEAGNQTAFLFTLTNAQGSQVKISNYGAIVSSWLTKDRENNFSDIVIGFETLAEYGNNNPYFGCIVGRYCNRIKAGKFEIDGNVFRLTRNNGNNHLHGGQYGFDKMFWHPHIADEKNPQLQLRYTSKDGEEGYPGNLYVLVEYSFTDSDQLIIRYHARTDAPTPVNLTNHSYFNLTGDTCNTIHDHSLQINAAEYVVVDDEQIPTGKIATVNGTVFDFSSPSKIGTRFSDTNAGYDHCYVLNSRCYNLTKAAATLCEENSGRKLEVFSSEPGLQLYTGNHLDGSYHNREGLPINKETGVCLETQHFPDSPNQSSFPSCMIKPGENYFSQTIYKVSVY